MIWGQGRSVPKIVGALPAQSRGSLAGGVPGTLGALQHLLVAVFRKTNLQREIPGGKIEKKVKKNPLKKENEKP